MGLDKGKPIERWGRKATGLSQWTATKNQRTVTSSLVLSPVKSYPLHLKKSRKVVPLLFTYPADVLSLLGSQILGKESNYGPKRTTNDA